MELKNILKYQYVIMRNNSIAFDVRVVFDTVTTVHQHANRFIENVTAFYGPQQGAG